MVAAMAGNEALKRYRTETRKITQDALAKELGVHPLTISRWETGERRIDEDRVPTIAEKTGLSPADLRPDLAERSRLYQQAAE